ncbi:unnamed protein product, partial [Rotaria magnacalcarata]
HLALYCKRMLSNTRDDLTFLLQVFETYADLEQFKDWFRSFYKASLSNDVMNGIRKILS